MSRRPSTLEEVARLAGVSTSAVSRSFTPGASVSAGMRRKVLEAAGALGYRPNLLARSLSRQRSQTIGIAGVRLENNFNAVLLQHLTRALRSRGLSTRLFLTAGDSDEDPDIGEILHHRVDGIILCAVGLSSRLGEECAALGVPLVMVNRAASAEAICVVGANREGGETIAAFLSAAGHRNLAFVSGTATSSTSREREEGFIRAASDCDLPPPQVACGAFTWDGASEAVRTLLRSARRPDAIFCANDHMALAAMTVAEREFGFQVGSDLSIVGFDDSLMARVGIGLTSFSQPTEIMALKAAEKMSMILDGDKDYSGITVSGHLIVRGSARIPPTGCSEVDSCIVWRG